MKRLRTKKNLIAYTISAMSLSAFISPASAAPIELVNQGFETGDLTGWSTIGTVTAAGETNVTTNNGTNYLISPNDTTMAHLDSFGASVSEIETFLGINSGSLFAAQDTGDTANSGGNFNLTNGSAISQSFTANAGDTIDMSWNYVARDYIPYTDPSFAVLVGPGGTTIDVLASTTGPGLATGSDGISGVFTFAQELTQAGEYTLGFAVTNSGDTILNAALFLDDAAGSCNPACNDDGTPENPLLPINDDTPDEFDFSFTVTEPTTPIFIDPDIAIGYNYVVNSGPNVASVILPNIGDGVFDIFGWDGTDYNVLLGQALANIAFDFAAGGVDMFQVLGIETSAMLDPTDSTAFVTGLTWTGTGIVDITQSPISVFVDPNAVPEPSIIALLSMGLIGLCFSRRRSQSA
jgi:hypothetical protein